MKRLTCEMCGSTDLLKQDGVFICQSCGCRYSTEEAKKMMVEGTVDVSGSTIKVDTSVELANLYQIARRAKDDNNSENAEKYYDMILVKDPTSWEAAFYAVYFKAMECKIAQIRSAAISVNNCENSVLTLIRDYVPAEDQEAAVSEVVTRSIQIAKMLADGASKSQEYVDNICASRDILYTCGSQIEDIFGNRKEIAPYAANAWKAGIDIHSWLDDRSANKEEIDSYVKKVGKYDPAYERQYTCSNTKAQLESARAQLEREISILKFKIDCGAPTPRLTGLYIFFILSGILSIVAGVAWGVAVLCVMGVIVLILVPIIEISRVRSNESDRKIASEAKEQLVSKETELKELQAQIASTEEELKELMK